MAAAVKSTIDHYLSRFEAREKTETRREPAWLREIRKEAIARFVERGFPTLRDEEWRYTNVSAIAEAIFQETPSLKRNPTRKELTPFLFSEMKGYHLVFINGIFSKSLSTVPSSLKGVKMVSLAEILATDPACLEPYFARKGSDEENPFAALNTAFARDGAYIYIPKETALDKPIHLLFYNTSGTGEPIVSYPRILLVAGRESKVTVIEHYAGAAGETYLTGAVTEIVSGENTVIDHYKLQRESEAGYHFSTMLAQLDANCRFTSNSVNLGGAMSRNDLNVLLDAEGIDCVLNGLSMIAGRQHVDNRLRVEHAKPHCRSVELFKYVLDGKARGVFRGTIHVHPNAQKTDAKQTNKNLLLSDEAEVDTLPQLEIYADDVKCTHGATVGQLDENELFYLRSRGIDLETARNLLTFAFAGDIVHRIRINEIRSEIDKLLFARLPKCHILEKVS